jgi:hypothetical protein
MKNLHVIYSDFDKSQVKILEKYGIKVETGYDRFDIEENETYIAIKPYLDKWKIFDTVISKFTREEEDGADLLVFLGNWANGYPMPDGDAGYKKTTYNNAAYCEKCGFGLQQKEPFRLKKAPNWGSNKKMFSLNWVYDELFLKKDFYEEVFQPLGFSCREVLLYKKESIIADTVQLIIPVIDVPLKLDGYPFEICKVCSQKRWNLVSQGFFPPFDGNVNGQHLFKSKEWFGTGANTRKYIFMSAELRQKLNKTKIRASYYPCQ